MGRVDRGQFPALALMSRSVQRRSIVCWTARLENGSSLSVIDVLVSREASHISASNILRGLVAQFPSAPTSHGVTFGKQKDRPKEGSNLTAARSARGPIGAIDRTKIVCLICATRRKYQMRIALT